MAGKREAPQPSRGSRGDYRHDGHSRSRAQNAYFEEDRRAADAPVVMRRSIIGGRIADAALPPRRDTGRPMIRLEVEMGKNARKSACRFGRK